MAYQGRRKRYGQYGHGRRPTSFSKKNHSKKNYTKNSKTSPLGKEPGQRDTTKNHGRLGGICQTHFEYNDMFLCCCSLLFLPIFRKCIGPTYRHTNAGGCPGLRAPQVVKVGSHTYPSPPPPTFTFLAESTPLAAPIANTVLRACLLCLRKTQVMWGKRTGFEAVTTRSSVARTNHRATATTAPDMC